MFVGALGTFVTTAPLPMTENGEAPTMLIADTQAYILSPYKRLKGSLYKTVLGILHKLAAIMSGLLPLQFIISDPKVWPL